MQALGVVYRTPAPYADLPIFGLPSRSLVRPLEINEHGQALRRDGWPGISG